MIVYGSHDLSQKSISKNIRAARFLQAMKVLDKLTLTKTQFCDVMRIFEQEMEQGLSSDADERNKSSLQMEITYIRSLLNGKGVHFFP